MDPVMDCNIGQYQVDGACLEVISLYCLFVELEEGLSRKRIFRNVARKMRATKNMSRGHAKATV